MRICSFLPSATEMLFALGLGEQVVAVSHECDYPPEVQALPRITSSLIDPATMTSAEIDQAVSQALAEGRTTYAINAGLLAEVRPDLVVTQDLCAVCAIGGSVVRRAASSLDPVPRVLSLDPHSVEDVLACLLELGQEAGVGSRAERAVEDLRGRIASVQAMTAEAAKPRVLCLEWLDPPWIAGHWMPEVVDLARGLDVLGVAGTPSRRSTWHEIGESQPDVAIIMPCGFGVEQAVQAMDVLRAVPELEGTPAWRDGRVYVVDASSYYSRSGPRIVDGIELMAHILHPELVPNDLRPEAARHVEWLHATGRWP